MKLNIETGTESKNEIQLIPKYYTYILMILIWDYLEEKSSSFFNSTTIKRSALTESFF